MSPQQLHRMARQVQFEWRRDLARQRQFVYVVAIAVVAITGLVISKPYW